MLSLLSSKQLPITESDPAVPKIVDFNTIDRTQQQKAIEPKNTNFFTLWPFRSKVKSSSNQSDDDNTSLLDDSTNKVIAMKKIDSSSLKPINGAGASITTKDADLDAEDDEDFINIELRQLSYAEVAALNKTHEQSFTTKSTNVPFNSKELPVIDQEDALGKSITDLEIAKSFENQEKFKLAEPINNDVLPAEDQWDIYVESKTTKKNKKLRKGKKRTTKQK